MFPKHVHAKALEVVQVIDHGFPIRRRVDTIRPEPLIQGAKVEEELAVEQRPEDAVDLALGNGAEPGVARDLVVADRDGQVVQRGRVGRPEVRGVDGKGEGLVGRALVGAHLVAVGVNDGYAGAGAAALGISARGRYIDRDVDCWNALVRWSKIKELTFDCNLP